MHLPVLACFAFSGFQILASALYSISYPHKCNQCRYEILCTCTVHKVGGFSAKERRTLRSVFQYIYISMYIYIYLYIDIYRYIQIYKYIIAHVHKTNYAPVNIMAPCIIFSAGQIHYSGGQAQELETSVGPVKLHARLKKLCTGP